MRLKKIFQKLTFINNIYTKWKWRERKVSYGEENPDITFFVIRRATCKVGLFSHVMTNMGLVRYALDNKFIPVIDMKSNLNTYLEEEQVGKNNAWEFYFEQPCGYSLEDINNSRNIILSNGLITKNNAFPNDNITRDVDEYKVWRKLFSDYFFVKKEILEEAKQLRGKMFGKERVLGILCRGTDYVNKRPKNHPIQPDIGEMIVKARDIVQKYNCRLIFLATEDEGAFQRFYEAFGDKLKVTEAKRCKDTGNKNINDITFNRINDKYLRGKEYLINILILSECNCLIAGSAGGTYGALLMGAEYEYQYIYNIGIY